MSSSSESEDNLSSDEDINDFEDAVSRQDESSNVSPSTAQVNIAPTTPDTAPMHKQSFQSPAAPANWLLPLPAESTTSATSATTTTTTTTTSFTSTTPSKEPSMDIPLVTTQETALPEGCFHLTKINKQGEKITVLARANKDGEIITLDSENIQSQELLGDMDEVLIRLKNDAEKSASSSSTSSTSSSTTTTVATAATATSTAISTTTTTATPQLRIKSHKRSRLALEHLVQVQNIAAHQNAIWIMKCEPIVAIGNTFYVATGGQDKTVRVWLCQRSSTGASPKHTRTWSTHYGRTESSSENLRWKIIETPVHEYQGHTSDVVDLAWSPNSTVGENGGRYLLSASLDKTVRLWHTSRKECLCVFAHPKSVTCVDFHPSKQGRLRFLTGCFDSKIRVWDVETGKVTQWTQVQNIITSACFRPDGTMVVAGLIHGVVVFLHYDGLKFYTQVECRNRRGKFRKGCKVTGLQWSTKNDSTLLVSTNDSRMRILRTTDFAQQMKFKGVVNQTMQIHGSFSPDGSMIVSGSEDGRVVLWRTDHDWYNPGKSTARMTGYSKDKNDSYESFEGTIESACTGTAFMPFMTTIRDAVIASAKRKLASGLITEAEFAELIMSQAKHDMQMMDTDDYSSSSGSGGKKTDDSTTSVAIVLADAEGHLKLFVSGCALNTVDETKEEVVQKVEKVETVETVDALKVAVGRLVVPVEAVGLSSGEEKNDGRGSPPPQIPNSKRPSLASLASLAPALPTRVSVAENGAENGARVPPPIPTRRSTSGENEDAVC